MFSGYRKVERWAGVNLEGSAKPYTGAESFFLGRNGELLRAAF